MIEALGSYTILERIGAGGLGEVYRARDTRHGRTVAIKVVPGALVSDPERRERLLRDAHATATLSHPNIATLYEVGDDQGRLFLVFDFVPGQTLKAIIGGRPMHPRRAIDLAAQVADGLADAHAAGIVHQAIRPDNIIVSPKGTAKILDYGLAAWMRGGVEREEASTALAGSGPVSGMTLYVSPEQGLGEPADERADIFSLGVMLFEMLTGKPPSAGQRGAALTPDIVRAPAPVPSSINASLPRELDPIVAKALSQNVARRYASAATFAAELRSVAAILDVRSDTSERRAPPRVARPAKRSYRPWIALAAALAALAAAAWFIGVR